MASLVLFTWPIIAVVLHGWLGRERGLIWSVLIGYLFLPERTVHELPGLPDYDKILAISLGALLGRLIFGGKVSFPERLVLPPARDMPQEITDIWSELLELEDVPRKKSFVALGGSRSRMNTAVRRMIDIGVEPAVARKLYDGATISELNEVIPDEGPSLLGAPSLAVVTYLLFGVLFVSAFMTMLTNDDPLVAELSVRPGLGARDFINMMAEPFIIMVPSFFALDILRGQRAQTEVARAVVVMGVLYAFLAAFEVRMSPQLNVWIYGYFQHSWIQHLRDGFRPIVFLSHGLAVGFFLLTASMMSFGMFRHGTGRSRLLYLLAGLWILAVLAISRNLGAMILAVVFIPMVLYLPRFFQIRIAVVTVLVFLLYPAVWQSGILPIDRFLDFVASVSEDRAQTFQFRLDNEAAMLERAAERPIWGWGGWDRWRVFDEQGRDLTTADGLWIITLGMRGWVGYISFFLILTLPVIFLMRAVKRREPSHAIPTMSLIMAANLIYLIPNSTLSPAAWMITGTIAAFVRWHVVEVDPSESNDGAARTGSASIYTRFPQNHSRDAHHLAQQGELGSRLVTK